MTEPQASLNRNIRHYTRTHQSYLYDNNCCATIKKDVPIREGFTGGGGCCFHEKAEKYERYNEIHVIAMICHTVSEYHV